MVVTKRQIDAAARDLRLGLASWRIWHLLAWKEIRQRYRRSVLGDGIRVAVEAASTFGWERWVGPEGAVVGMTSFGASGKIEDLYRHFGITAEAVAQAVLARI